MVKSGQVETLTVNIYADDANNPACVCTSSFFDDGFSFHMQILDAEAVEENFEEVKADVTAALNQTKAKAAENGLPVEA